jgi:hypothetical protein
VYSAPLRCLLPGKAATPPMAATYLRSFFQRDTLQCARESGFWKAGKQDHLEGASKA